MRRSVLLDGNVLALRTLMEILGVVDCEVFKSTRPWFDIFLWDGRDVALGVTEAEHACTIRIVGIFAISARTMVTNEIRKGTVMSRPCGTCP